METSLANIARLNTVLPSEIDLSDLRQFTIVFGRLIFNDPTPWRAVAQEIGVTPQTLSRLAYGETKEPRLSTIRKVAEYYGYSCKLTLQSASQKTKISV